MTSIAGRHFVPISCAIPTRCWGGRTMKNLQNPNHVHMGVYRGLLSLWMDVYRGPMGLSIPSENAVIAL